MFVNIKALFTALLFFDNSFYLTSSFSHLKKYFRYTLLAVALCASCCFHPVIAQDSTSVHSLLRQIEDQQLRHDPFFMPGIFPSYVSNKKVYRQQRKDNNVFYTALISYTLKKIRPGLPASDQTIVDSIISRSEKAVVLFKNRKGKETYNFWRTDSAYRLPYLWGLNITKKNMLDDDPDCTSICLLSLHVTDPIAQNAHEVMQDYVNDAGNPTQTTFSRYRSYEAYSTWMGNRLPVVFDICVLCNILTFVQEYNLPWSKADSASLDLIVATINNKDHLRNPFIVAPYYGGSSVILYHLARLMSIKPIPALEALKDSLASDAQRLLQQTHDGFEKIVLSNALLKWNLDPGIPTPASPEKIGESNVPFFIGNIPSIFNFVLKKPLSKKEVGFYYHYCPAFNNVLLLEHVVLRRKSNGNNFTFDTPTSKRTVE
jgi:hypothetical protein